jgi:hypothetical protein
MAVRACPQGIEAHLAAANDPFIADSPNTSLANRRNRVRDLDHSRRLAETTQKVLFCAFATERQLTAEAAHIGSSARVLPEPCP